MQNNGTAETANSGAPGLPPGVSLLTPAAPAPADPTLHTPTPAPWANWLMPPKSSAVSPQAAPTQAPGAPPAAPPTTTPPPANIGAPDSTYNTTIQTDDVAQAQADMAQFGLTGQDAQQALDWYKQQETSLVPAAQMQINMYQQPWFQKAFPGIIQQIQNGQTPMSPQDYETFKQGVKSFAANYGLPQNFVDDQNIADMVGKGWTFDTFNQRVGLAFNAAANAPVNNPETVRLLDQWYHIKPGSGALAAFYLDPQKAISTLAQATTAAQAGASADSAGFQHLDQQTLMSLAANKSLSDMQSGIASSVPLLGVTKSTLGPGQGTPETTEKDLLAAQLGNVPGETQAQAIENVQLGVNQRVGALHGGGGGVNQGAPGPTTGSGYGTQ